MKKIALIILSILLITGCTIVRIDTKSIDNILNVVLSKDNKLYNRIGKGYKYYIPKGVTYVDTIDLNDKLYDGDNYYYLYIDAVSYFYKTKTTYNQKANSYYSKKLEGKKEGYLEINEVKDKYKIEFFYNYAKIEALVDKDSIESTVLNASYILSTVKFNDNVIKIMLDDEYFTNKEEKYTLFNKKDNVDSFLEYSNKNNK